MITVDADDITKELVKAMLDYGYGDAMTVTKRVSGSYDTTTGTAPVTTTAYTTTGKLVAYKAYPQLPSLVQRGDRKAILIGAARAWSPGFYLPIAGDTLTVGVAVWNIVDVQEITLQGECMAIICQVRGSARG